MAEAGSLPADFDPEVELTRLEEAMMPPPEREAA